MILFEVKKGALGIVVPPEGMPYVKRHASDTVYDLETVIADPVRMHNNPLGVHVDLLNLTQNEWKTNVILELAKQSLTVFCLPGKTSQEPYFFATQDVEVLG